MQKAKQNRPIFTKRNPPARLVLKLKMDMQ
jgi:hypothetical protein